MFERGTISSRGGGRTYILVLSLSQFRGGLLADHPVGSSSFNGLGGQSSIMSVDVSVRPVTPWQSWEMWQQGQRGLNPALSRMCRSRLALPRRAPLNKKRAVVAEAEYRLFRSCSAWLASRWTVVWKRFFGCVGCCPPCV